MIRQSFFKKFFYSVVLVMFCFVSLTGCASLRKKFTRVPKNPKVKEDFIPVLQPVEYKKVEETPQQIYAGHYTMLKVYFKDLWEVLGNRNSTTKREKYIFTEMMVHFDAMTALLSDEKKAAAREIKARVDELLKEYDKPDGLRRHDLIASGMRRIERDMYKAFKPDVVAKAFAAAL